MRRRTRSLRFETLDDLRAELDRLGAATVEPVGGWTAGQNYWHLAAAFDASMRGLDAPASIPRPVRWLARRGRALVLRRGWFPPRLPVPVAALVPPEDADETKSLRLLRRAIDTFERTDGPPSRHPVLGPLTRDEWMAFHLRHCELHLKHLVPIPAPDP